MVLLRDMAGDAATNAANVVRPSEDQLSQIDRPAEDNTWHEKPTKEQWQEKTKAFRKKGDTDSTAGVDATLQPTSADTADQAAQKVQKAGVGNTAKSAFSKKLDQRMDPETKEKLKQRNEEYRQKSRDYLNKKMPQERKDQTIWRLKKMILECQQHPDYSQAIQTILKLAEDYGKHGRSFGQGSAGSAKEARTGFAAAEADLRTLIERFANGTSTEDLWDSIDVIFKDTQKDAELRGWFKDMDVYVRRCLLDQGYVLEDESTREWDGLYEKGRYLLRQKYRSHTDRVVDEVKFVADQFDQDPQNKAFANAMQKLFNDLGNDENGKPTFKPHLIKDLTQVIIPGMLENAAYIPIPRIEYSDEMADVVIENLVMESDNFMPNVAELASEHYFKLGRKKVSNKGRNTVDLKVSGIQLDLRDVSYHIKKKKGFPSITDTGVVDIMLPGNGLSFNIKMSSAEKSDQQNFFKVDKVDVDIKSLKLKFTKSNHKLLLNLVKPIALRVMHPILKVVIQKVIKQQAMELDSTLFEIKKDADRSRDEARASTDDKVPNSYKRFYDAAQKHMLQAKENKPEPTGEKKVNIAMTHEDSIFPNIKLDDGISSKASEYKELARKGEKWESPVFSIGNAKKSNDVPNAPQILRKPHAVNGAKKALNGKSPIDGVTTSATVNGSTAINAI